MPKWWSILRRLFRKPERIVRQSEAAGFTYTAEYDREGKGAS